LAKKKSKVVKFAVGPRDSLLSSEWIVIVSGDDVYVGAKDVMGSLKLSLHALGLWDFGFTTQSGQVQANTGNRRVYHLERPRPFKRGWTQGPLIFVPCSFSRAVYVNMAMLPRRASAACQSWFSKPSRPPRPSCCPVSMGALPSRFWPFLFIRLIQRACKNVIRFRVN
jgi:hypothetical protein